MNIFVLNSGRCGSTTFIQACSHISNFTCAHESAIRLAGEARVDYPANHIEADNRLSWFLGRLDRKFGDGAKYVHLTRDRDAVAQSYARRLHRPVNIVRAFRDSILLGADNKLTDIELAKDYVDCVTENIEMFLKDKSNVMRFRLERAANDFPRFWRWIDAEGDFDSAVAEFEVMHNSDNDRAIAAPALKATRKLRRIAASLPEFLRNA